MTKLQKIIFILIVILFASCEKKATELEFEKNVMTEIFPVLVDSICVDCRIMTPPPPIGESIFDNEGRYVRTDTTKATKEQKIEYAKWKNNRIAVEKDTSKVIVAFAPILQKIRESAKDDFEKHFPNAILYEPEKEVITEYNFEFENIQLNNKFVLKNLNDFPKERGVIWTTKYNFIFSGVLDFTRIQFDKNKIYGILDAGFGCGSKFGQGFRIYIKKHNKKWIIDKIEPSWIS
jgi:hypothetical protein